MKIVPAILTDKREELSKMLNTCKEFTDYVHIDIMDGKFVLSRSITLEDLEGLRSLLESEAHLMVKKPLAWLDTFKSFGVSRIIFHFEIKENHLKIIKKIRDMGCEVGIAVNPSTEFDDFEFLVSKVDVILFMSVNPGFYGSSFIPGVLEKIKKFKKIYPHKSAGIDGGIKSTNVSQVAASRPDYICVGSAILKEENPRQAYLKFLNEIVL